MLNRSLFWSLSNASTGSGVTQLVSLTNLLAYWKLDSSYGRAVDSVGTHDSSIFNVVQSATGKIGNSFTFNGTSSYIDASNRNSAFDFGTSTDFSLAAWFKTSNTLEQFIISKYYTGTYPGILFQTFESSAYAVIRDGVGSGSNETIVAWAPTPVVTDNIWHYMIATYDRDASLALYVDGIKRVEVSIYAITDTINNPMSLMIGRRDYSVTPRYFNGNIDEVAIWRRVLTANEVSILYNNGNGLAYPFTSDSSVGS